MKKLLAFILLLIYFTVTTGFVVSIHYCMDEIQSVAIGVDDSDECGRCGMKIEKNDGCCKNDVKLVKMKAEQPAARILVADFSILFLHSFVNPYFISSFHNFFFTKFPIAHSPPLHEPDIYIRNCVFRV